MKTSEQVAQYVFAARDEYIEKQKIRRAKMMKAVPFGAAAVIALAAVSVFAVFRSGINSDGRGTASGGYSGNAMNTSAAGSYAESGGFIDPYIGDVTYLDPDTGMEVGWDEKPLYEKFRSFTHEGQEYICRRISDGSGSIPESSIGEKLYDITMTVTEFFSQQEFTVDAEVFAINDILPDAVTAVKYDGTNEYCAFMNYSYWAFDLGSLIDALDLTDTISFGNIYIESEFDRDNEGMLVYDPVPVSGDKAEIIKAFLEECRGLRNHTEGGFVGYRQLFSISVDCGAAGIANKAIWFSDSGIMMTNIMEHGDMFYVGEERIQQLAEALGVTEQQPYLSTYPVCLGEPETSEASGEYGVETTVMYTTSSGREVLSETTVSDGCKPTGTAVTTSVAWEQLPETTSG